jgi:hypothetical protein
MVAARRLYIFLATAAAAVSTVATAPAALAHRDGCHRWHSCPSDSGSYVCGDLGYTSGCGTGYSPPEESSTSSSSEPYVPPDYLPPDAPETGSAMARAGVVTIPVAAERGARIRVVDELAHLVTTARATGSVQRVTFRGVDGQHTYTVTATDSAGNESFAADVPLAVDATAPARPRLSVAPPEVNGAFTTVRLAGEAGVRWALRTARRGAGNMQALGRDGAFDASGQAEVRLLTANGAYVFTATAVDGAGNTAAAVPVSAKVAVPAPTLSLERTSADNSGDVEMTVRGPARGTGVLTFSADGPAPVTVPVALDDSGAATVTAAVTDGLWWAAARVTDVQRRPAAARLAGLLVDTAAPALDVTYDGDAASHSTLALGFVVEPGATVVARGLPGGDRTFAEAGPQQVTARATDGVHRIRLVATDAAGNSARRDLRVKVSTPASAVDVLLGLLFLLLLGLGVFLLARAGWRRRWRIRAALLRAKLTAAHNAAVKQHAVQMQAHAKAVADANAAEARWNDELRRLEHRLGEAKHYTGDPLAMPPGVKHRQGEILYAHARQAGLVEMRRRNGFDMPTVIDQGDLWITTARVLFSGTNKNREWSFDKLVDAGHADTSTTLMAVTNRQKISGFRGQGEEIHRRFDLALAESNGTRPELIRQADQKVRTHTAARPARPGPAPAPPAPPILPSAADLEADARRAPATPAAWPNP